MNANVSVTKQKPSHQKRVAIVALIALLGSGALAYWLFFSEPAQPWRVRWRIARYLKKQTGKSSFPVNFKFPSKREMAKASADSSTPADDKSAKGGQTRKDFDTLKSEYIALEKEVLILERELAYGQKELDQKQAQLAVGTNTDQTRPSARQPSPTAVSNRVAALQKELPEKQRILSGKTEALAPIVEDLWAFQRAWAAQRFATDTVDTNALAVAQAELTREIRRKYNEATTYSAMYELIGQQLWVAGRLFTSANVHHRRVALTMARQATGDALRMTEDSWLAARICEGYVWPNLDAADYANWRVPLSVETLLNDCADVFRRADEIPNVIRNYRLLLIKTKNPQRMDWARVQLAQVHEQAGEFDVALRYLKQVKATNGFNWAFRRLPWLEQRVKAQR